MSSVDSPGVSRWRQHFAKDSVTAMGNILASRVSIGQFDGASPSQALFQILINDEVRQADKAMQSWLEQRLNTPCPTDLSAKRYSAALIEAFRSIQLLSLSGSRDWCAERPIEIRAWLRNFYAGSSRDPESAFLVILAHHQTDCRLGNFWRHVVAYNDTEEHVSHAKMGLQKMPLMPCQYVVMR